MYFDTSYKKLLAVGIVGAVLCIAVAITFEIKNYFFGTTPFFPATGIFFSSIADNAAYTLASGGRQMAGIFSALIGEEEQPTRDARAIPVLTYHRITGWHGSASGEQTSGAGEGANVSLPTFRDQMEALKNAGWETVTLLELEAFVRGEASLPERSFVLTFDDGAKDSFYPVDPLLRSLGYTAVNYLIVTGTERKESTYYLSTDEVNRMLDTGRWEIGSHTYDAHHPIAINAAGDVAPPIANLAWRSRDGRLETVEEYRARLEAEFLGSKSTLERAYGVEVDTFAFPFGDTGEVSLNFGSAESVALEEAQKHYDFAFIQNDREHYTFNYPSDAFLLHRIRVESAWSGVRLLREMESGLPKDLPYADSFDYNDGWISSWGSAEVAGGVLTLAAQEPSTSASAILDGTRLWSRYEVTVTAGWNQGYALVLVGALDARTYRSCAYADGRVRLQQTGEGTTTMLGEVLDASVSPGDGRTLGARITGSSVSCLYDGRVVLTVTGLSSRVGGVGVQAWDPTPGIARLRVTDIAAHEL